MTYQDAIRKAIACLRLSKSSNPHEAALAASRAQEIIDKYKLDVNDLDHDKGQDDLDAERIKDFGYEDPLDDVSDLTQDILRLATVVTRANCCRALYTGQRGRSAKIKIVGRPSDASAARYLYGYLKAEMLRITKENCAGNSWTYRRHFRFGIVDAIAVKLSEQKGATVQAARSGAGENSVALVRVERAIARQEKREGEIQKWMDDLRGKWEEERKALRAAGFRVSSGRGFSAKSDVAGTARAAGRVAGQSIRIGSAKGAIGNSVKQIK